MKNELPRRVLFFDTETTEMPLEYVENDSFADNFEEKELVLKLGVACLVDFKSGTRKWYRFTNIDTFWKIITINSYAKTKLVVVAHNLSFDFRVVKASENLKKYNFKIVKMPYYKATAFIAKYSRDNNFTLEFLDNMNYFKSSLKELGKSIGILKMEMPTNDIEKLFEYCYRDVEIMVKAWDLFITFLKDNDLGNFSPTIASQAFNAYRHRFMNTPIYIHTNKKAIEMERNSYHGGRTECFMIGKLPEQNYYLLDVNSMYPSVMLNYEYPTKLARIDNGLSKELMKIILKSYCVTADVTIKTSEPVFPVVKDNKLIFPVGIFKTTLTTREILYALDNNMDIIFGKSLAYEKAKLFENYVDFFFSKKLFYKEKGNEQFSYLCKLFLNSLYGKFGQRNEHYVSVGKTNADDGVLSMIDFKTNKPVTIRAFGGKVEKSTGLEESFNSMVAISAHITSDARMRLWNYFKIAGRENVFYCDTDSMIVNVKGFENSKNYINKGLGFLSIKEQSLHLVLRGAKDYEFGNDIVIKGIRKDALKNNDGSFTQTRFEGMSGALRKGRTNKMIISKVTKKLKREYNKGTVLPNGIVVPFNLGLQDKLIN